MMKKIFAILLCSLMLCGSALAEGDLGIQLIGGSTVEVIPVSLDDLQFETLYEIDGYARVTPKVFMYVDYFGQFNKDADYNSVTDSRTNSGHVYYQSGALKGNWAYYYKQATWQDSGLNGEFAWLMMDITNMQKTAVPFMEEATVKVVYDDDYEFNGWIRQINYDYNTAVYRYGSTTTGGPIAVLNPANEEAIDMMYTGTYIFGCTLPNAVVEDKETPLRMEITLGENELTYHIRKEKKK